MTDSMTIAPNPKERPQATPKMRPRVLIVEDDARARSELMDLLGDRGFDCFACGTAEQAIAIMRERPDLAVAVVDIGLPGLSGLDFVAAVRERDALAMPTRFILVTGDANKDRALKAMRLKVEDLLAKPLDPGELIAVVERAILAVTTDMLHRNVVAMLAEELEDRSEEVRSLRTQLSDVVAASRQPLQQQPMSETEVVHGILSMISHELRTPLIPIMGYAQMLNEDSSGVGAVQPNEIGGRIYSSATTLLEKIDSLLDLMNGLAKGKTAKLLPEGPLALAQLVIDRFAPAAKPRRIRLDLSALDAPRLAVLDRRYWSQALAQVLRNAIEHSSPGGVVLVSLERRGRDFVCSVTDDGPGMDASTVAQALKPFRQASEGLVRVKQGLGIGLPLARRLIECQGGSIELRTAPGEGTTVSLVLPLVPDDAGVDEP